MKKYFKSMVLILLCVSLFLLTSACGQSESKPGVSDKKDWPKGISISSAPLGGTFHVYATAWASIINKNLGIATNVEATAGPIANIQLVNNGQSDVGLVTMGPAYEAYNGIGWTDQKHQNIRTIFPMYVSYLHWFVAPNTNIKTVADFEGKVVGTGARGGTPDYYTVKILDDLGIKASRIINSSFSEYANLMADKTIHAFGVFAPTGHPTGAEVIRTQNAKVMGLGEKSKELAKKYGITSGIMKAKSYEGQTEDIETLTIYSAFAVNKNLPDSLVYELVKTTFEQKTELQKAVIQAAELNLDIVPDSITAVPLHPGAIKYYEEKGVKLPKSAYPPEYSK
ncbi:MAG: hypothetical protein JG781_363 [Peptococcaceae bacterium]|nr:hypothetical protein [Peptococcaceae bacterium]